MRYARSFETNCEISYFREIDRVMLRIYFLNVVIYVHSL